MEIRYEIEGCTLGSYAEHSWKRLGRECRIISSNPKLINVSKLNIGLQNANKETFQPTPFQNCKAPIRFVYGSDDQLISGPKTVS